MFHNCMFLVCMELSCWATYPIQLSSSPICSACAWMLRNLPRVLFGNFEVGAGVDQASTAKKRSCEWGVVRAVVLACYFFARHHCSGRPQRWASGIQRGEAPLYRHSHAGTSSDEPLEEEDARREEAERSAVATDTPRSDRRVECRGNRPTL